MILWHKAGEEPLPNPSLREKNLGSHSELQKEDNCWLEGIFFFFCKPSHLPPVIKVIHPIASAVIFVGVSQVHSSALTSFLSTGHTFFSCCSCHNEVSSNGTCLKLNSKFPSPSLYTKGDRNLSPPAHISLYVSVPIVPVIQVFNFSFILTFFPCALYLADSKPCHFHHQNVSYANNLFLA